MKVPAAWIQDYLTKTVSTDAMAEALETNGIEVEQIIYAKTLDDKIVSARVKKVVQHPDAERLKLATVETGAGAISLVCGAPNLKTGLIVALAQVGAKLPDGTRIKATTIRGQDSHGMLCSPKELGLSDDHSGLLVLDPETKPGVALKRLLPSLDVIDVTTQANRFDLQSIIGLAREVAARHELAIAPPAAADLKTNGPSLEVAIDSPEVVDRYLLAHLQIEPGGQLVAPARQRLEAAGLRKLGRVVDITNFVMLEQGQPLHAFDAAKVKLPITVRWAKPGEKLITLDGTKRNLTKADLVIADRNGPIALAGVMGGQDTEVTAETTEILLEAASFKAATVRKTAQRHGLRSDASARFERSLPPELAEQGLKRALHLLEQEAEGRQLAQIFDSAPGGGAESRITVDPERLSRILSIEVTPASLMAELPKLGLTVSAEGSSVIVTVPWWRPDLRLPEDIAEEYIRLVGYDQVPARLPKWQPTTASTDRYWPMLWQAKSTLKGLGLFEVITYSFLSLKQLEQFGYEPKDHLKLKNPLSLEQAYLRRNLLPSLLMAAVRNQTYQPEFGLYEVSRVFLARHPHQQPDEPTQLGVLWRHRSAYQSARASLDALAQAFRVELTVEPADQAEFLPTRAAMIKHGGTTIGRIGELHPRFLTDFKAKTNLSYLELNLDQLLSWAQEPHYQPISRFPSLYRDLTIKVKPTVLWQAVAGVINSSGLARPSFLGDYYAPGQNHLKHLTIRLEMSSLEGTLTDREGQARLKKIIDLLARHFGAQV